MEGTAENGRAQEDARPERTSLERELFERALPLDSAARERLLGAECGQDAELRGAVERLLRADADAAGFLDAGVVEGAGNTLVGRTVGPYSVVRELGSGGSSTVYEAWQDDPPRLVALKILHLPLPVAGQVARFRREAALLARLAHPGIVTIHDVGEIDLPGGPYPYLALELVRDARPITRYADEAGLALDARLELFASVCDAVAAAHREGVVHRDLKPANLLVDGSGRARVIDFGVARVLEGETGATLRTLTGQIVGTPVYMSPEQLLGVTGAVDARADVWSLGMVLFELLTGVLPFDVAGLPITAIARTIVESEPRRLSAYRPELRGDLEVVVDHALAADPHARYRDAGELRAELERVRAGQPIEARRDHRLYVLRKRIARHRVLFGTIAIVMLVSIASAIGFLVLWRHAEDARGHSEHNLYDSKIAISARAFDAGNYVEARRALDSCEPRFREWEWRHLAARVDDSVWGADLGTQACVLAPSPDGAAFAVGCRDGSVHLFGFAEGPRGVVLRTHSGGLTDLCWVGSNVIATAAFDRTARLWDLSSQEERLRIAHPEEVWVVESAPDGSWLATGARDGRIRIFDPATGERRFELAGHGGGPTCLTSSPDGALLASGGRDRTLAVWNPRTGELVRRIDQSTMRTAHGVRTVPAHGDTIGGTAFDASGRYLYSASPDGYGKMWSLDDGELRYYEFFGRPLGALSLPADGGLLAIAATANVQLRSTHDSTSREPLRADISQFIDAVIARDGARLAAVGLRGEVRCFALDRRGGARGFDRHQSECYAQALSGDGTRLISADDRGWVQVYETAELARVQRLRVSEHRIRGITSDGPGEIVVVATDDRRIRRIALASGAVLATVEAPPRPRIVSTGRAVLAGGDTRSLVLLDAVTLAPIAETELAANLHSCSNAGGGAFVAADVGGEVRVFDDELRERARWSAGSPPGVARVLTGNRLLTGHENGEIRIWSLPNGVLLRVLPRQPGPTHAFEVLPGEKRLFVEPVRGAPRLLDLERGTTLLELSGHDPNVILRGLVALGDGRFVTADDHGVLRVWSDRPLRPR